ncbi:MAG: aminodeoxychorismate lyase [Gammaproteobacteria bacterium]
MILVNGEHKDHIEITDRGFQYGDGLFETIEVRNGAPVLFDLHLARLHAGCRRLKIPCPDAVLIRSEAHALSKGSSQAVLKLIVTRGSGGRGYRPPEVIAPTRIVSLLPYPDYSTDYRQEGITARFCDTRLGINPALAGLKHLNRLEQVMARAEWNDSAIQEGIMLDMSDNVIEGTMSNVFVVKNKTLYTPALTKSGIEGIIRYVILTLSARNCVAVIEKNMGKDQFLAADEIFVCNSLIGIWPIKHIENHSYPVGQITRQCQIWLNEFINETLSDES